MHTLNHLTQSRLAAFLIDQKTHSPVRRLPVYGELEVYQAEVRRVEIDGLFEDDIVQEQQLQPLIESAIERQFGGARFEALSRGEQRALVDRIIAAIGRTFQLGEASVRT